MTSVLIFQDFNREFHEFGCCTASQPLRPTIISPLLCFVRHRRTVNKKKSGGGLIFMVTFQLAEFQLAEFQLC